MGLAAVKIQKPFFIPRANEDLLVPIVKLALRQSVHRAQSLQSVRLMPSLYASHTVFGEVSPKMTVKQFMHDKSVKYVLRSSSLRKYQKRRHPPEPALLLCPN
jgi:hypothetical protein